MAESQSSMLSKLWIVVLMVSLLLLSMIVTFIRQTNDRVSSQYYVPLERSCPDYWELRTVQDGNKKSVWCETQDKNLQASEYCIKGKVGYKTTTPTSGRVHRIRPVRDRDVKKDIASQCNLPWDGISTTAAASSFDSSSNNTVCSP